MFGNHCSYSIQSFNCAALFCSLPAFLGFLCISESLLTPLNDVVALRFLLFLSHVYGVVLLLITPLIAVETLSGLLWPPSAVTHRTVTQRVRNADGRHCYVWQVVVEEEDEEAAETGRNEEMRPFHAVSYLCCLSLWVVVALDVRWRWKLEEARASSCLHTTNSLIRCLPNQFSLLCSTLTPWSLMVFLLLLLLLVIMGLQRSHRAHVQTARTCKQNCAVDKNGNSCWQDSAPVPPAHPWMWLSAGAQCVDPEKTENSCTIHSECSWNSMHMSTPHHGDLVIISPECLSAGQEHDRTKGGKPLKFTTEEHAGSRHRSQCAQRQWGFPCLGVNVIIGFMGVLCIFVLPLILSVNILLLRTIETLLELCIKPVVVSSAANTKNTSTSHNIGRRSEAV